MNTLQNYVTTGGITTYVEGATVGLIDQTTFDTAVSGFISDTNLFASLRPIFRDDSTWIQLKRDFNNRQLALDTTQLFRLLISTMQVNISNLQTNLSALETRVRRLES